MKTVNIQELYEQGLADINIVCRSRAADTATLVFRLEKENDAPLWSFGEEIALKDLYANGYGSYLFHGYVIEDPEISVAVDGVTCTIKLGNIVALLDATPYTDDQSFNGFFVSNGNNNKARLVSAKLFIEQVLAQGKVLPGGASAENEHFEVDIDATIKCPTGSGSQTCWGLIEDALHWVPDAVTWYSHDTHTLHIGRAGASKTSSLLDIEAGLIKTSFSEDEFYNTAFAGYSAANFRARRDLCPPAVGLSWEGAKLKRDIVFPSDGNLRQPWAFFFQIPKTSGFTSDLSDKAPQIQEAAQTKMTVRGRSLPQAGWSSSGINMKRKASMQEYWANFWESVPNVSSLCKKYKAYGNFGQALFSPISAIEASNEAAANYKELDGNGDNNVYLLIEGQFPASTKASENVSGLKWCRAKLKQYFWLTGDYKNAFDEDELNDDLPGSFVAIEDGNKQKTRYVLIELDAVFINRRLKRYQVGTNKLDSTDEDYTEDSGTSGEGTDSTELSDWDYIAAAQSYYNATRKLFWDGSITLHGVPSFSPSTFAGTSLNIVGARPEWASMNTPIVQVEYSPKNRIMIITTGSPEILSIDERVQRTLLARQSIVNAGTSFHDEPKQTSSGDDGTEEEKPEYGMISPSISVNFSVTKNGRPLNPFQVFCEKEGTIEYEDVKWFINEGTLVAPGGAIINFPITDITDKKKENPDAKWIVRPEREKGTNTWKAVVRMVK